MGSELTESTIPAEAGQWIIDQSVSFTKGCYTGQELVARIDSRGGNVPRHLRGLVIDGDPPPIGSLVVVDGAEVGALTSVGRSPELGASIALAFVARKVDPPADAVVRWDGGEVAATIKALPLV
jgi:folate-binding protein YgfZ